MKKITINILGLELRILHVINSLEIGGAEGALVRLVSNDCENEHIIIH